VIAVQQQQHEVWSGKVTAWTSEVVDDDFVQARMFWKDVLGKQEGEQEACKWIWDLLLGTFRDWWLMVSLCSG
jgi:hypothetical protein